jgi:predicted ABC-class ATPase
LFFLLVVAPTGKIAPMTFVALRPMVAEVNWEGFHHRDRWSSLLSNCRMVFAEKVSEQVVMMMAPKTIVEARE